ncbi:hypothetical protein OK074_7972 [Actinobacteria bacterium OK074]|nr:hypothetical protein OK074_7972 [Actinobacteria bacterium OK074]
MSASSHPRLPRTPRPGRGARTARTTALAVFTTGLALAGVPAAHAAPGDNGDVKVHEVGTLFTDQRDEPKVCHFYLDAFNFDVAQSVTWDISTQPAVTGGATLSGAIALASGTGHTLPLSLPNGQYKLVWKITGGNGTGKQKVFKVDCPIGTPTPPGGGPGGPGGGPGGPNGGVPAGGGGLALDQSAAGRPESVSPLAATAAVGLVVAGGVVYFRLLRRRPDGAA